MQLIHSCLKNSKVNHRVLSLTLTLSLIFSNFAFEAKADKQNTGAIVGAIIGGVLGNQVGKGKGKDVATGIGIILGAVVGSDIGRQLDDADRRALSQAQKDAFNRPVGSQVYWEGSQYGSQTGCKGNFRTTREGYRNSGSVRQVCREYENVIMTSRKTETQKGISCRNSDGSWIESNSQEVVFSNGNIIRNEETTVGGPTRPEPRDSNISDNRDYRDDRDRHQGRDWNDDYRSNRGVSLKGYCRDYDDSQYRQAMQFASSQMGLYRYDAQRWASEYNDTHRCNTINELSQRFSIMKSLAKNTLGMFNDEANSFALSLAEKNTVYSANQLNKTALLVKNFTNSYDGLNFSVSKSNQIAKNWILRGTCEDSYQVQNMWDSYSREFNRARNRMGMYSDEAKRMALIKVSRMTVCSDLLR